MSDIDDIVSSVDSIKDELIDFAREILSIPAIAPESDGTGEMKKAERILEMISDWGFDSIRRYDSQDDRVPEGKRPNILLRIRGEDRSLPSIWVFSHIDIVPPGDLKKWTGNPYELRVEGDRMIARGVEDNGQDLIASLFAAKLILSSGLKPRRDINIFMVADEEVGSAKGMVYLMKEHEDLFSKQDLFIVPDAGEPDGSMIEVAEKSIMWIKVSTFGKQVHASVPQKGVNANLAAMRFLVALNDELYERYPDEDELYDYPRSSFTPTKREANVPNVNSLPGEDVSYIDCRIMPHYRIGEILGLIRQRAKDHEKLHGVNMKIETLQLEQAAPPTSPDHPVVGVLKDAVEKIYGLKPRPQGIGGGTCAAILRRAGYPAAVWSKLEDSAHMPDEFALIENYIGNTKVFIRVFLS